MTVLEKMPGSEPAPIGEPQYLVSNLSVPHRTLVAGSSNSYEKYLHAIGADGMELTPLKTSLFYQEVLAFTGLVSRHTDPRHPYEKDMLPEIVGGMGAWWETADQYRRLIKSAHSGFRKEIDDDGLVASRFQKWAQSIEELSAIQNVLGCMSSIVVYTGLKPSPEPNHPSWGFFAGDQLVYDNQNTPFKTRTFQVTAESLDDLGLTENSSSDAFIATMGAFGVHKMTADTKHMQSLNKPVELAHRLALSGLIDSVHLSVNRLDMVGSLKQARATRQAKRSFVHSSEKAALTPEGEILAAVVEGAQKHRQIHGLGSTAVLERVVLEDGPARIPSRRRDEAEHGAILAHARELVASAHGTGSGSS